jgi:hypothetical protein
MKHKHIKYLVIIMAGSLLWSCKKELNVYPTTSEVDGNVIVDTKSATTVLNGVYYRFANSGVDNNSVPSVLWTSVNEILPSELANSLSNSSGDDGIYSLTFNSKNSNVGVVWNYGYALVNAANGFIKNATPVAKIPAATKTQMLAEARFLRAFGNAELLLYYGQYYDPTSKYGIILRDQFVTAGNINLPRSDVAAAYTSILGDLDTAIMGLPAQNTAIYYANASAAKLLKARMLINRGAAGDYAEVITLTNDVITNGPFALEDSVKDIFLTKGFSSKEVILGVQPYPAETFKFQQNQFYGQYFVSDTLVSLLKNDPRNQWVYRNDNGGTEYGHYYGPINELTKYYSGNTVNPVQTPLSEYCYAFRLTEAYLLEAEAITLSKGNLATAKTLLETVEAHAGVKDFSAIISAATPAALQVLIVKEEIKNFFSENGADWFALRRLPFATAQTIQPALISVNQLTLPIPYTETSVNNLVIQNPGY